MIPEAAVEAAAKGIFAIRDDAYDMDDWEDLDSTDRELYECQARAALEAAAPHMRELQWGVRDIVSLHIAGHPSEESARSIAAEHPEWYEVVSRPMPGLWTAK